MKKRIGAIGIILTLLVQLVTGWQAIPAEAAVKPFVNLVLFAEFADSSTDTSQNYVRDKTATIQRFFNDYDLSFRNYMDTISYGQFQVQNYFPQQDGSGEIIPYTLSQPMSYYTSDSDTSLIQEVVQQYAASGVSLSLDCLNAEGFLDNLTIVIDDGAASYPEGLSSHKSDYPGYETIAGKRIGTYNVVLGSDSIAGVGNAGVISHEFLHSLGYSDLYHKSGNGTPVGGWDIMASTSYFLQYPLAYFRSAVSGWISIPEVTADQQGCTLYAPTTSGYEHRNEQALILRTPYSDKEFFVVEYRRQGTKYTSELEQRIPGTGLIIYRVNTNRQSNTQGGTDMVYVFRPGDTFDSTGVECGAGDLSASFLSAQSGRTSYGCSDMSKTLTDDAITYSDGTNSGIVISNVGTAEDTISFDITFHHASSPDRWEELMTSNTMNGISAADCAMDEATGDIYSLQQHQSTGQRYLYRRSGSVWQQLGSGSLTGNIYSYQVGVYDGAVYAAYAETVSGTPQAKLAKWNGSGWQVLATLSANTNEVALCVNASGVYAAATDNGADRLLVYQYANGSLQQLGSGSIGGSAYHANISISADRGQVLAFYRDFYNNNTLCSYVYQTDSNSWRLLGQTLYSGSCCTARVCSGKAYLVRNLDGSCKEVLTCDLSSPSADWVRLGNAGYSQNTDNVLAADIAFSGTDVYVLYSINGSSYVSAYRNGAWSQEGGKVAGEMYEPRLFTTSGTLYSAYLGGIGGRCFIKTRTIPTSSGTATPGTATPGTTTPGTTTPGTAATPKTYIYNGVDYSAVFQADYYLNRYADLRAAFGNNEQLALKHFVEYGMKERRQASPSFQVMSYYLKYQDLRRAFGQDWTQYYLHYLNHGIQEKRIATGTTTLQNPITVYQGVDYSAVYDYNYYYGKYADLRAAFGQNDAAMLEHFVLYGMSEGRQGSASFDVNSYYLRYPDLRRAFGQKLPSYYLHYVQYGTREGRIAAGATPMIGAVTVYNGVDYSAVYDYNYYYGKYADLRAAFGRDDASMLEHFVLYGMGEGRQAKSTFHVQSYRSRYRDLQNAFGGNLSAYYLHYIQYGIREGRTGAAR